jgi:hypothetical protein
MIMPGVQKPHCRPWQAMKASCTGCSVAVLARPSTVVTLRPAACTASTLQLFTAWPSSSTVQAPHWLVSQPTCVPVRRIHCQTCAREISAVAASSIRLLIGTAPLAGSQASMYCSADADVVAQAGLGDRRPGIELEQVGGGDLHVLALRRDLVGPRHQAASNTSSATGTRPGWATQVPSWPSVASRSLSARTLANASALASGRS